MQDWGKFHAMEQQFLVETLHISCAVTGMNSTSGSTTGAFSSMKKNRTKSIPHPKNAPKSTIYRIALRPGNLSYHLNSLIFLHAYEKIDRFASPHNGYD
jgi:hypothetical protein